MIVGDAAHLDPVADFKPSIVVARNAFHHMDQHQQVVSEMRRIATKNTAFVIIECTAPSQAKKEWQQLFEKKDVGRTLYQTHDEFRGYFENLMGQRVRHQDVYISRGNDVQSWVTNSGRAMGVFKEISHFCESMPHSVRNHLGIWLRDGRLAIDKQFSYLEFGGAEP